MDSVSLYLMILAAVVIPPTLLVAFLAHRQRMQDEEAEDRERPVPPMAE